MELDLKEQVKKEWKLHWRKHLRQCGILLILICVGCFVLAQKAEDKTRPARVTTGVIIEGRYMQTGTPGYLGDNSEVRKAADDLRLRAGVLGTIGVSIVMVTLVPSASPRRNGKFSNEHMNKKQY